MGAEERLATNRATAPPIGNDTSRLQDMVRLMVNVGFLIVTRSRPGTVNVHGAQSTTSARSGTGRIVGMVTQMIAKAITWNDPASVKTTP